MAAMSNGSIVAIGTSANGSRTTSPARNCGIHCSALDMNPLGRSTVQSKPESLTAASETTLNRTTALSRSPPATAPLDNSTTRPAPAARMSPSKPVTSG